ncbi:MAG: DUF4870 domain-containing protein [Vampirovibrio sp.]|nr:DUF4870 domain-containing protein [Vampirovibrio sp.]
MTAPTPQPDSSDDNLMAGLSYLGLFLCLVPTIVIFLMKKDSSAFIKFCSIQGIALWVTGFALSIVLMVLSAGVPVIGFIFGLIQMLFGLVFMGYTVFLSIQAFRGEATEVPFVGQFVREKFMN